MARVTGWSPGIVIAGRRRRPTVSVVVTANEPAELLAAVRRLQQQDYQNFEVVATLGGTIANGYNRAVQRAKGQIVVFTETDAVPLSRSWLRELVAHVRRGEVVKGLEVRSLPFNFSNTACPAAIARRFPLDERYVVAEDTEWSERLRRHGTRIRYVHAAGVLHQRTPCSPKALRRAYPYGRAWARLRRKYTPAELPSLIHLARNESRYWRAVLRGISAERRSKAANTA